MALFRKNVRFKINIFLCYILNTILHSDEHPIHSSSFMHLFKRWFVLKTSLFTLQITGEEIKSEERPFWFAPRGLNLTVKAEEKPKEDPFASFKKMNPKDRLRQYLRKRMENFSTNQNVFARVMSDVDSGRK